MKKKKILLTIALMLVVSLMLAAAGCSGSSEGSKDNTSNGTLGDKEKEAPYVIKILWSDPGFQGFNIFKEETEVIKGYEEKFNIDLQYQASAMGTEYTTIVQTRLAAGVDLPDVVQFISGQQSGIQSAIQLGQRGVFLNMGELIDKYAPNIKAIYDEKQPLVRKLNTAYDGNLYWLSDINLYHINNENIPTTLGISIRSDWMKHAGINKIPETTDEYYEYLKACQDTDANGNGIKDEILACSYADHYVLAQSWGVPYEKFGLIGGEGDVVFQWEAPGAKEYIAYSNKLYKEGLLDNEAMTWNYDRWVTKLTQNRVSSFINWIYSNPQTQIVRDAGVPDAQYIPIDKPLNTPLGDGYAMRIIRTPGTNIIAITNNCKKPERVMEFFDFLYSEEGALWYQMGVPDVHRELVNGEWKLKSEVEEKLNNPETAEVYKPRSGIMQYILPLNTYIDYEAYMKPLLGPDKNYTQEQYDAWKNMAYWPRFVSQPLTPMATNEELTALDNIGTDVYTYIDEEIAKFVVGERNLAEWDNFIQQCYKLGIGEIKKIKQSQVFRFYSN